MKKRKMITIMLAMILSVTSCFSAYCAETSTAEVHNAEAAGDESAAEAFTEETSVVDASVEEIPVVDASAEEAPAVDASAEEESAAGTEQTEAEAEEPESEIDAAVEDTLERNEAAEAEEPEAEEGEVPETFVPDPNESELIELDPLEFEMIEEVTAGEDYAPDDARSSDDLFAGYVDAEFGIDDGTGKPGLLQAKRDTAGSKLKGDSLAAYDYISALLPQVASGEITETKFTIPGEAVTFTDIAWTAEDLGVSAIARNGAITAEAKTAASAKLKKEFFDLSLLIDALLADHPYLLYWYDKTPKTTATGYNYRAYRDVSSGVWYLGYKGSITINFPVAEEYAAGEYIVDASIGQTVQTSVDNAHWVVSEYDHLPDRDKLAAYRQEICDLTSYNYEAINEGMPYGNPWQLIWVFDQDPSTKVVCEGYAKAFKYLCDKSSFEDEIDCKTVTGRINGSGHMWNIVTMGDDWNYLVDVTNCDKGTVGADDKLFLVGADGSPQDGYTVYLGGYLNMYYTYDSDMTALWSVEELTLSPYSYPPFIENAQILGIEDKPYTGDEITQDADVLYNGRILTEGEDYTVSYENNTEIGTAKMTIEGAGPYYGSIEREFAIVKAPQPLEVDAAKIIAGKKITARVTGAKGEFSVELSDPATCEIISDDGAGTLEIRGVSIGTATLTVRAEETEHYKETVLETQIRVVPSASTKVWLTNVSSGIKISWNEVAGAKYYKVYRGEKFLFATSRTYATDTEVKLSNGTKYTYKVFASTTKEDDSGDSTAARTGTGYRLMPVGIRSVKNTAAGKMTVTYDRNEKATGYVVRFGLKSDMSDAKVITVSGAQTLSRTFSGLKKGKTYYVQVRTYLLEGGTRFYSGYCTTKTVRIMK